MNPHAREELLQFINEWLDAEYTKPQGDAYVGDPAQLKFDFDSLRLVVAVKLVHTERKTRQKEDLGYKWLSRELGVTDHTVSGFLQGTSTPTVDTTIRLMAWVGYTDFAEFLMED